MPEPDYYVVFRGLSRNWVMPALLFWAAIPSFSQVTVSFPTSRIVFQRSIANTASFTVSGAYQSGIPDRVEAALEPVSPGMGTTTDWQLVEQYPVGGVFSGTVSATGGWYTLKVRVIRNGLVSETAEVDRVGIGEVFVVAGQSNARGIQNYGAPPATDDRVNCFNYLNAGFDPNEFPEPSFSHLNADSYIAPYGFSAWSWGILGDLLVARLNVPVLFYNAALEGTTSRSWRESTVGSATNPYIGGSYMNRLPYSQLRISLQQYASLTGIRAILWQQGESDTQFEVPESEIVANLQQVIGQSRSDAGHNLSWVMARVSYNTLTSSSVINAQNTVINSVPNMFAGPFTDGIQIPRPDGVHLQNNGLKTLAEVWDASLTAEFFTNSNPRGPLPLPTVKIGCADEGKVKLRASTEYLTTDWNIGAHEKVITVGKGVYRLKVKDAAGNFMYSPALEINESSFQALPQPPSPVITSAGSTTFCEGDRIELTAGNAAAYQWSNGALSRSIVTGESNNYTVRIQDENGCWSSLSQPLTTVVNPTPVTPTVLPKGPLAFCADQTVTLEVEGGKLASTVNTLQWTGGQTAVSIVVKASGEYAVRAVNQYGCFSPYSQPVSVTVHPLPAPPVLSPAGAIHFCADEAVTLYSDALHTTVWNTGETSPQLLVRTSGHYTARTLDSWGCQSLPSAEVTVQVSPIPSQPVIEKSGNFTLKAQGSYLSDIQFRWDYNGQQTITGENFLKVPQSADYTVTAFYFIENGKACTSLPSQFYHFELDLVNNNLNLYPNPARDGIFWAESYEDLENVVVQVISAEGRLAQETRLTSLKTAQAVKFSGLSPGAYTVRIRGANGKTVSKKLWVLP
ncbi:MAG: sialate O-acetylesterase [Spirosomataceae bacterium]